MTTRAQIAALLDNVSVGRGGPSVSAADYEAWLNGRGDGDTDRFQLAVLTFLGCDTVELAERLSRVPALLEYALGAGGQRVGNIDLHQLLVETNSPALTALP